jgi:alkaline phosphatase D
MHVPCNILLLSTVSQPSIILVAAGHPSFHTMSTTASASASGSAVSSNRIVFASCNSQDFSQDIWNAIVARDPAAFVWGGDTIYADNKVKVATPEIIQRLYQEQLQDQGYRLLLDKNNIPIFGVTDDHNYGVNNGDKTYPYKTESNIAYVCDFLNQQGTAFCDRAKQGKGVYAVKVMDFTKPKGQELLSDQEAGLDPDVVVLNHNNNGNNDNRKNQVLSNRSVAIYLLDMRTNRSPNTKHGLLDSAQYDCDLLGEEQWKWFEESIGRSTAAVNIVIQGIQVHANRVGSPDMVENWAKFPTSQHRLYQVMLQDHVRAPILISGDVHHAQLLRNDCQFLFMPSSSENNTNTNDKNNLKNRNNNNNNNNNNPRMLLEVTTSGMTHAWGAQEVCARPKQNMLCRMKHVKWAANKAMQLAQWMNIGKVWTEVLDLPRHDVHWTGEGKPGQQYALDVNFAELEFDWITTTTTTSSSGKKEDEQKAAVTIRVLGKEVNGPPFLSTRWELDELSGRNNYKNITTLVDDSYFRETYNKMERNGGFTSSGSKGQWICVAYRGKPDPVFQVIGCVVPIVTFFLTAFLPFVLPFLLLVYGRGKQWKKKQKLA